MLSKNKGNFISIFPICMLFRFFLAILLWLWPLVKKLNRNGKSGHFCLISYQREKTFIDRYDVALGFQQMLSIKWRKFSSFAESFFDKIILNFGKCFFCICLYKHDLFSLVNTVNYSDWFSSLNKIHGPAINPNESWCIIPLYVTSLNLVFFFLKYIIVLFPKAFGVHVTFGCMNE